MLMAFGFLCLVLPLLVIFIAFCFCYKSRHERASSHKYKLCCSRAENLKEKEVMISILNSAEKDELPCSRAENVKEKERTISLLDLPEVILENIFERLSISDLNRMAHVYTSLRQICASEHLLEKLLVRKWGRLIGDEMRQEWQSYVASRNGRPFSWIRPILEEKSTLPVDSIMALYLCLHSGQFMFPAQIYHGENNYKGNMLVCADAWVLYDPETDTFGARYPSKRGVRIELNVEWNRVRAPQVGTDPYMLQESDCLNELKPGDHIEIQWRAQEDVPFGLSLDPNLVFD